MLGLGPMKIISLKHPKKNGKGLSDFFAESQNLPFKFWKL